MNAESKRRRQKAVIGIVLAVVIVALFTVTIGIGTNNGDTGDGVVGMGGPGDTLTAYGNGGEATSSNDVRINGILSGASQLGLIDFTGYTRGSRQTIYEGTSGFLITITCTGGSIDVTYYVDGKKKGDTRHLDATHGNGQSIALSHGFGKGELKRIDVDVGEAPGVGAYEIV